MTVAPPANVPGFWAATNIVQVPLEQKFGDVVFARNGELWTIAQWSTTENNVFRRYIEFARIEAGQRVVISTHDPVALLGSWCPTDVNVGASAHEGGAVWLACRGKLLEMDLATTTILRSIPAPENMYGFTVTGDRAFVGTAGTMDDPLAYDLFEIALADGGVRASLGADVRTHLGESAGNVGPISVVGDRLLVRGAFAYNEALLFDLATGDLQGFVTGAPTSGLATDPNTGTTYGFYHDTTSSYFASFELSPSTLRTPALQQTFALPLSNARAVAHGGGLLWALFSDATGATLLGYDPATQQAVDGFVLDQDLAEEIFVAGDSWTEVHPVGLAVANGAFYIAVNSDSLTFETKGSSLFVLDFASGQHTDTIELDRDILGLCAQGSSLYGYDEPDPMVALSLHLPKAVEIDPNSGDVLRTIEASKTLTGNGKLLCGDDALGLGSNSARVFSVMTTAASPVEREQFSFGVSTAGHTGVEVSGSLWMLDRVTGQLLQMTPMLGP